MGYIAWKTDDKSLDETILNKYVNKFVKKAIEDERLYLSAHYVYMISGFNLNHDMIENIILAYHLLEKGDEDGANRTIELIDNVLRNAPIYRRLRCEQIGLCVYYLSNTVVSLKEDAEKNTIIFKYYDIGDGKVKTMVIRNNPEDVEKIFKAMKITLFYSRYFGHHGSTAVTNIAVILAKKYMNITGEPPWFVLSAFKSSIDFLSYNGKQYIFFLKELIKHPANYMFALYESLKDQAPELNTEYDYYLVDISKRLYNDVVIKNTLIDEVYRYFGIDGERLIHHFGDLEYNYSYFSLLMEDDNYNIHTITKALDQNVFPLNIATVDIISLIPYDAFKEFIIPLKIDSVNILIEWGSEIKTLDKITVSDVEEAIMKNAYVIIAVKLSNGAELYYKLWDKHYKGMMRHAELYSKYINTIIDIIKNGEAFLFFNPRHINIFTLIVRGKLNTEKRSIDITLSLPIDETRKTAGMIIEHLKKTYIKDQP